MHYVPSKSKKIPVALRKWNQAEHIVLYAISEETKTEWQQELDLL